MRRSKRRAGAPLRLRTNQVIHGRHEPPIAARGRSIDGVAARIEDDIIMESEVRELSSFQQLVDGKSKPRSEVINELADQWIVRGEAKTAFFRAPPRRMWTVRMRSSSNSLHHRKTSKLAARRQDLTDAAVRRMIEQQLYLSRFLDYRFRPKAQVTRDRSKRTTETNLSRSSRRPIRRFRAVDEVADTIREVLIQRAINDNCDKMAGRHARPPKNRYRAGRNGLVKLGWKHWTGGSCCSRYSAGLVVVWVVGTGLADRWMLHEIVSSIETSTGTRVEVGGFHFEFWQLAGGNRQHDGARSGGAGLRRRFFMPIGSRLRFALFRFFDRQIALNELIAERPQVRDASGKDGKSNLPTPQASVRRHPWTGRFSICAHSDVELRDGAATFNDRRSKLTVQGQNLNFTLQYVAPPRAPKPISAISAGSALSLRNRAIFLSASISPAKFTLHRDAFDTRRTGMEASAFRAGPAGPAAEFRASGLELPLSRTIIAARMSARFSGSRLTPDAITDFSGRASYASEASAGNAVDSDGKLQGPRHQTALRVVSRRGT